MKKLTFIVILIGLTTLLAACSLSPQPTPPATGAAPGGAVVLTSTPLPSPTPTPAPTPTQARPAGVEPGIPAIVDKRYFGIPAGNGYAPHQVAVDSQRQRIYTMNYGLSALKEGNTLSVIDLKTGTVAALLKLGNMGKQDFSPPTPLDLQVDPYRPRLYAIWGDRYAEATDSSLTIIDTEALTVVATLPGVEAIAPGPDRLYLANDTRLWTVDPASLAELAGRDLEARTFNEPLLLNAGANRLYLGRGYPWSLEVFAADSLLPVGAYPIGDELVQAVVDAANKRLLVVERGGEQIVLRALNADGQPLVNPAPISLGDSYSDFSLALTGQTLYVAGGEYGGYWLRGFALPDLTELTGSPLASMPDDLAADAASGLIYAAYSWPVSYVLTVDPAAGPVGPIYTALTITAALADPAAGRLYLLDEGGTLQVLSLADTSPITPRLDTGFNFLSGYYDSSYGQLSLDPRRHRLAISGDPVRTVDTASFQVTAHPDLRGQVTLDPASDRVYLTPPCACRIEQCNTLILSADTLTGTKTLFPPEDPFTAPCVIATSLDSANQLLYADIYNGTPGSNSGDYFSVFDVSGRPEKLYTAFDISFGQVALDPLHRRAFFPRYRIDRSFIHRFEAQGGTVTQTLELAGAQGQLVYDPGHDRLYAVTEAALQVYDGDLALLAEITLPGEFDLLTFDPQGGRLYLRGEDSTLLAVATGGGQMEPPPPAIPTTEQPQIQQLLATPDGVLFRVYDLRLYRSADGGQTWQLLGKGLPGRPMGDLAVSPDYEQDRTLLAGLWGYGRGGGLYRSTDGGDTWRPTSRGLTDMEISKIVFSPAFAHDRAIFLTTFDHGLFRSTDGGDTWTGLAGGYATDPFHLAVDNFALSPTFADDRLLIINYRNLLRSTDGGDTWVNTGIPGGLVAFSPDFAHDGLILSDGRWRSVDGGQTWQPAAVGLEPTTWGAQSLFFSPHFAADQTIYVLLKQDYDKPLVLQRSVDAGRSWGSLLGGLPSGFEIASATVLPSGELHLSARDERQVTIRPAALEWGSRPVTVDIARIDLQDLAVAPDGTIFVANGAAGVFKSVDGGRSWQETDFPARAAILSNARLALADDGALFAAIGTVVERSDDGGQTWTHLPGLPLGFQIASLAVSPNFAEDGVVVVGGDYFSNQIIRSADGGKTWRIVFDGASIEGASDVVGLAFSPDFASDGTLYAWLQYGGLLRSTDGGRSWSLAYNDQERRYYGQTLLVSPAGDRLYLGALDGQVLVSEDNGQTWLDLGGNVPDTRTWSSALAFSPEGALWLGTDIGVYRSPDGGQTWMRANAGLPLNPDTGALPQVRTLRFGGGHLYVALSQGGLFVSDDQGQSWRSTLAGQWEQVK